MSDATAVAQTETGSIIREIELPVVRSQAINRIAKGSYFVYGSDNILDLNDAWRKRRDIEAVAVLDKDQKIVGIVIRDKLLALVGRPYGRDVLTNHPIAEFMDQAHVIPEDRNLFSVAEDIDPLMKQQGISYFVLSRGENGYGGIFSTQDMLVYLSEITQNDISLARRLQSRMVRDKEVQVGDTFEIAGMSRTAKGVGGDFYSIKRYAAGRWIFALCDVSGKGVAASIITSLIWGMITIYDFTKGLTGFVKSLNASILQKFEAEKFVTGVLMDYDERTGEVELCDMGHGYTYLVRGGRFLKLKNTQNNLPIGVMQDVEPTTNRFKPQPGDLYLITTDGLLEQKNQDGEEYSEAHIAKLIASDPSQPVELMVEKLMKDFHRFRGSQALSDDVTFNVLRFARQEVTLD